MIYAHAHYEFSLGQLSEDLDALDAGTDLRDWEGCEEAPQELWDWMSCHDYSGNIVAEGGRGKRKLHKDLMGGAAQNEFNVSDDDSDAVRDFA